VSRLRNFFCFLFSLDLHLLGVSVVHSFLSVALCTYNGARFLPEQLASLTAQTRLPDEVVVCDDASTDGTIDVVRAFAAAAPFPVRVETGTETLGSTPNFARAIAPCTGDFIALADQDDVWHPDKLATLEAVLLARPDAGLAFGNARLIDEHGRPIGTSLWDAIRFTTAERRRFAAGGAFRRQLRRLCVTGATALFRSRFRDLVLPIPAGWVHDAWIALIVSAVAECVPVGEPLIDYRQHAGQQIGGAKRNLLTDYRVARAMTGETFRAIAANFAAAHDRLKAFPGVPAERLRELAGKVRHAEARARMREPGTWRLPRVAGEWVRGSYARYSRGWKAAAQDLFLGEPPT
jgi:glycosyltransferase involved in cell wall biosynthesis